jgi:hypothetical protein
LLVTASFSAKVFSKRAKADLDHSTLFRRRKFSSMIMPLLSLVALTFLSAEGLNTIAAPNAAVPSRTTYSQLKSTPLFRASDEKPVFLPDLWRAGTPFGVADEIAVCAFLRHYG